METPPLENTLLDEALDNLIVNTGEKSKIYQQIEYDNSP